MNVVLEHLPKRVPSNSINRLRTRKYAKTGLRAEILGYLKAHPSLCFAADDLIERLELRNKRNTVVCTLAQLQQAGAIRRVTLGRYTCGGELRST